MLIYETNCALLLISNEHMIVVHLLKCILIKDHLCIYGRIGHDYRTVDPEQI